MLKSGKSALLVVLGLFVIACAFIFDRLFSESLPIIAERASLKTLQQVSFSRNVLSEALDNAHPFNDQKLYNAFNEHKTGIYIFHRDSLVYWNNSQLPFEEEIKNIPGNEGLVKLKHGYFLFAKVTEGPKYAIALCVVKPLYDLQNNYLKNDFKKWTGIPPGVELTEKPGNASVLLDGRFLFSLKGSEERYAGPIANTICTFLFAIGFILLFLSLLLFFKEKNNWKNFVLALLPLVIFKFVIASKPSLLASSFLYNLRLFADAESVMNSSLADLVFNSLALLYISVLLHLKFEKKPARNEAIVQVMVLFFVSFFSAWQFNHSLKSLIVNSTLSFDFLSIFNISAGAIAGLLGLVFNSMALFILFYRLCGMFPGGSILDFVKYISLIILQCVFIYIVSPLDSFLQDLWPAMFGAVLFVIVRFDYQRLSLGLGILILVMSAITSRFFNHYIDKDEKQLLKELSYSLSERQDPLLESEFTGLPQRIGNDQKLKVLLDFLPASEKEIVVVLKQKYFSGYFNRYNIDFSMFDKDCKPLLTPEQPILLNEGFFEDQIKFNSDSTFSNGLFFVKAYKKNSRYIGKIELDTKNLYVLMEPKQFEELGSFPDLLLDQSQQKHEDLRNASYAVYRSEQNTNRYGDFNYPYYYRDSTALANTTDEYVHHYYQPDESTHIIISKKTKNWNYRFTYNSYLFLFFSVVCYLGYYIYALLFTTNFKTPSLTRRIQTIVIVLLLLAMSAVGITSGRLVSKQFESDNIRQLQEKTQTIMNELGAQFSAEELFSPAQKELVNLKLKELTHLFNTDISLFDSKGALFNTSQPRLYEKGLAATLANPKAYSSLKENKLSAYTDTARAGSLKYKSLYTPVFTSKNELVGFVNLPYFAKQGDLANELSGIISALINVYVILFVISILAGLILAGYITKPLRMIKQQIANITLGKQNETIKWTSNDEVGKLVNEYNNMLLKLEHSAGLLAQSERESAWREMAKQVAHEIKNPLTPMKLNLQYLQHLMASNPDNFKEKFETASKSIIEQIDTLAGIANEFSNFAKLPVANLQPVNLTEVIRNSVDLFDKKSASIIHLNLPSEEITVLGDKEQALRVFNNILKNAVQAVEDVKDPGIIVTASLENEIYKISIEDNGCGIAEDMKEKIFQPNFTTKSTGSGLGLAMVKNIVNGFGGKIYFESGERVGTVFYLELRKVDPVV
jgi:signal transduction histidine kinase